jgi:hypothetical protein
MQDTSKAPYDDPLRAALNAPIPAQVSRRLSHAASVDLGSEDGELRRLSSNEGSELGDFEEPTKGVRFQEHGHIAEANEADEQEEEEKVRTVTDEMRNEIMMEFGGSPDARHISDEEDGMPQVEEGK